MVDSQIQAILTKLSLRVFCRCDKSLIITILVTVERMKSHAQYQKHFYAGNPSRLSVRIAEAYRQEVEYKICILDLSPPTS